MTGSKSTERVQDHSQPPLNYDFIGNDPDRLSKENALWKRIDDQVAILSLGLQSVSLLAIIDY
jgi:hypothetical protein